MSIRVIPRSHAYLRAFVPGPTVSADRENTLIAATTNAAEQSATQTEAPPYKAENPNHPRKALKNGRHCAVLGEDGWMPIGSRSGYGLYCDDTRFLSCLNAQFNNTELVLLAADISDGFAAEYAYSNIAFPGVAEQTLLLQRRVVLADGLHEQWTIANYSLAKATLTLRIQFGADFADMFEVRGSVRPQRGITHKPAVSLERGHVRMSYTGLDGIAMSTDLHFGSTRPTRLSGDCAEYDLEIDGNASIVIEFALTTAHRSRGKRHSFRRPRNFASQAKRAVAEYDAWRSRGATITTDNVLFNQLIDRSFRDLFMLRLPVPGGNMIAAGVPWFIRGFGRDQGVTGLQTSWLLPTWEGTSQPRSANGSVRDRTAQRRGR